MSHKVDKVEVGLIGVLVLLVIGAIVAIGYNVANSDTLVIVTDQETGVQYVKSYDGQSMTPRLNKDGELYKGKK